MTSVHEMAIPGRRPPSPLALKRPSPAHCLGGAPHPTRLVAEPLSTATYSVIERLTSRQGGPSVRKSARHAWKNP